MIPVRRTKSLLTASFRFHLTIDTLAVQLYTSSLSRRVQDFHPLERDHGAQTKAVYRQVVGRLNIQRFLLFVKMFFAGNNMSRTVRLMFKPFFLRINNKYNC